MGFYASVVDFDLIKIRFILLDIFLLRNWVNFHFMLTVAHKFV